MSSRDRALIVSMVGALAGIALLATWDAERESGRALEDFGREQETLAKSIAVSLHGRDPGGALADLAALERPHVLVLLLRPPGQPAFVGTDGRRVEAPEVAHDLGAGLGATRLSRPQAAALGLPFRTAMAGLARVGDWGIAVVATAERQRDRERRAQWRVELALLLGSTLVLGFGGVALRNQRKELVLERELALADTRRERDERLARANRTAVVGALAIGITHEISTPLNVISARAEQLRDRLRGDERNGPAVQIILEQTEHIDQIIRGLLRLARGHGPHGERVTPAGIVDGACLLVEHRFAKAGVALRRTVPDNLPVVHGEQRLLEHALVNLLLNACDACAAGGTVELVAEARGGQVALVVSDDGVGISREDIDHAMEPFFTTKGAGQGTGLGLTIAREIVESHRGRLLLAPRAPRGTRAELVLPAAEESDVRAGQ